MNCPNFWCRRLDHDGCTPDAPTEPRIHTYHCQKGFECDIKHAYKMSYEGICRCQCQDCDLARTWEGVKAVQIPLPGQDRKVS